MYNAASARDLRYAGQVLCGGAVVFMIGAFSAAYFRGQPPADTLEKLRLIAGDPIGWTAQAILFPIAMAIVAGAFGLIAARMTPRQAQRIAIASAALSVVACLLWLPISVMRLQLGSASAGMLQTFDARTTQIALQSFTFWPYTAATLLSLALMGAALALGGVLRRLGRVVAALAALCLCVVAPLWGDWPPFFSYLFTLALSIGLIRSRALP